MVVRMIPPSGIRYGERRDIQLTKEEGNRPFISFWIAIAISAAAITAAQAVNPIVIIDRIIVSTHASRQ